MLILSGVTAFGRFYDRQLCVVGSEECTAAAQMYRSRVKRGVAPIQTSHCGIPWTADTIVALMLAGF